MHIWHPDLIDQLPVALLCALHRDCCYARGAGWGKDQSEATRWVWLLPQTAVESYHRAVLVAMMARCKTHGTNPGWWQPGYRGKKLKALKPEWIPKAFAGQGLSTARAECGERRLLRDAQALKSWLGRHL